MNKWVLAGCGRAGTDRRSRPTAAVLVVRSSGPSAKAYPAGKALPDNQNDQPARPTTSSSCSIRAAPARLRGPGTLQHASATSGGSTSALAALGRPGHRPAQPGRGGSRRPTGATSGRNVWQADVGRSGNMCIANPADIGLYRARRRHAPRRSRSSELGTATAPPRSNFAAGQMNAAWPDGAAGRCRRPLRDARRRRQSTLNARRSRRSRPASKASPSA